MAINGKPAVGNLPSRVSPNCLSDSALNCRSQIFTYTVKRAIWISARRPPTPVAGMAPAKEEENNFPEETLK